MAVIKKNGTWWVDCYLNERRVRRKVGPDKRTAELVEKDLKVKAAKGEWLNIRQEKRVAFAVFCKDFLSKQAGKAASTYANPEACIRIHLVPFFGNTYLTGMRAKQIEDYVQERRRRRCLAESTLSCSSSRQS